MLSKVTESKEAKKGKLIFWVQLFSAAAFIWLCCCVGSALLQPSPPPQRLDVCSTIFCDAISATRRFMLPLENNYKSTHQNNNNSCTSVSVCVLCSRAYVRVCVYVSPTTLPKLPLLQREGAQQVRTRRRNRNANNNNNNNMRRRRTTQCGNNNIESL